jgi:hypothetical protein
MICPYQHKKTDRFDHESKIWYNQNVVKYYKDQIQSKIMNQLEIIKSLESVINYHKCYICNSEFGLIYMRLNPCNHVVCEKCINTIIEDKKMCSVAMCLKVIDNYEKLILK